MSLEGKRLVYLLSMTISLVSGGCTNTIHHEGCYVADPHINGRYIGPCKSNKAHGFGKAIGEDSYEGEFFEGIIHGYGTYVWSDGDRYIGRFSNGQIHGRGVMRYFNGEEKAGLWENGKLVKPR